MMHNTGSLEPCLSEVWRYAPDIDVGQMGFFSSRFFLRLVNRESKDCRA